MSERKVGVVAKEFVNKGFVFLSVDDKAPNVFAHVSAFKASGLNFNAIQRGDTFYSSWKREETAGQWQYGSKLFNELSA